MYIRDYMYICIIVYLYIEYVVVNYIILYLVWEGGLHGEIGWRNPCWDLALQGGDEVTYLKYDSNL